MAGVGEESHIRRLMPALCAIVPLVTVVLFPRTTSAEIALALPRSVYPGGTHVVAVPATNANADHYLHPAHRRSFTALYRIDGAGWLQFGTWHFDTGVAGGRVRHGVSFGYGINLFRHPAGAQRALHDVILKTVASQDHHVPTLRYLAVSARGTLLFVFFAYRSVEVEAYYEFSGAAPSATAKRLRHLFLRQEGKLVSLARRLSHRPTATSTPLPPSPTDTPTSQPTATAPVVTDTPVPTAQPTDTPTATATVTPTPTLVPVNLQVTAVPQQATYAPGTKATIVVHVTNAGQPVSGASVSAIAAFYGQSGSCSAMTDGSGNALCVIAIPATQPQGSVRVTVDVSWIRGAPVSTTTSFDVDSP